MTGFFTKRVVLVLKVGKKKAKILETEENVCNIVSKNYKNENVSVQEYKRDKEYELYAIPVETIAELVTKRIII